MKKFFELKLPEFALLDDFSPDNEELKDRFIILHIPTLSIVEIINRKSTQLYLKDGTIKYNFKYINLLNLEEKFCALLYKSAYFSTWSKQEFIDNVMRPVAKFYCRCRIEIDKDILDELGENGDGF